MMLVPSLNSPKYTPFSILMMEKVSYLMFLKISKNGRYDFLIQSRLIYCLSCFSSVTGAKGGVYAIFFMLLTLFICGRMEGRYYRGVRSFDIEIVKILRIVQKFHEMGQRNNEILKWINFYWLFQAEPPQWRRRLLLDQR